MMGSGLKEESFSSILNGIDSMMESAKKQVEKLKENGEDVSVSENAFSEILKVKAEIADKMSELFKDDSK